MLPRAARDFYALQQRVNIAAQRDVVRHWRKLQPDASWSAQWRRLAPFIVATVTAAQREMAQRSVPYAQAVAASAGLQGAMAGQLVPEALVGIASDGRPLDSLLYRAVVKAGEAYNDGAKPRVALAIGGEWLRLATQIQVADTARVATGVQVAAQPDATGYVRLLNPPCCQRCAILAGRVYRWSTGFDRHPGCDCIMVPVKNQRWAEAEGFISDPLEAFRKGWIKDLTSGQRNAIADGANMAQVVNSKRGKMTSTVIKGVRFDFTTEGTTKRGLYHQQALAAGSFEPSKRKRSRLTPETIYRVASDREHAIQLLRQYGYIRT